MKANRKPNNKTVSKIPRKTIRKKSSKSSNPLPIILISLAAFILFILVIILATSKRSNSVENPQLAQVKVDIQNSNKKPTKKIKESESTKQTTPAAPTAAKTDEASPTEGQASIDSPPAAKTSVTKDESTKELVAETPSIEKALPSKPPKEQSIANLKNIGKKYKEFADNHQGHMPIELFQLELQDNEKISPLTNKEYFIEQEGKGSFLKDSLEYIIVREAEAVNGKYICLLGNGEVKEFDASTVEQ